MINKDRQAQILLRKHDQLSISFLAGVLNISLQQANLLFNRRIKSPLAGSFFLKSDLYNFHPPLLMKDMLKVVQRIKKAMQNNEKIMIYGDFDVDGITATAILITLFQKLQVNVDYYIPLRATEGYGLNQGAIMQFKQQKVDLLITVDCGISALKEVEQAKIEGIDTIITDHHQPANSVPNCSGVLNPKQRNCRYPFKELCGAGIAFKLAQALIEALKLVNHDFLDDLLDLAALGTIADLVPLMGENRLIVKKGLNGEAINKRKGLLALQKVGGLTPPLTAGQIAFGIAPRLNACGRLENANIALKLLLATDEQTALELAQQAEQLNQKRQNLEQTVFEDAVAKIENQEAQPLLIAGGSNWHNGVIGIAASRITEIFHRPCYLISFAEGSGRGSARSIKGFDLYQSLVRVSNKLIKFGGHQMAAGFSLKQECWLDFKQALLETASPFLTPSILQQKHLVDQKIDLTALDFKLAQEIEELAPFGIGNAQPLFIFEDLKLLYQKKVGKKQNHLMLSVQKGSKKMRGIAFKKGDWGKNLKKDELINLIATPQINEFNQQQQLQLNIKDFVVANHTQTEDVKVKLNCPDGKLLLTDNMSRTTPEFIEELFAATKLATNLLYVVSTIYQGQRALSSLRNHFAFVYFLCGLTPPQIQDEISQKIKKQKQSILIVTAAYFEQMIKQGIFWGDAFIFRAPFGDFPAESFYSIMQKGAEFLNLYGGIAYLKKPPFLDFNGSIESRIKRELKFQVVTTDFDSKLDNQKQQLIAVRTIKEQQKLKKRFPDFKIVTLRQKLKVSKGITEVIIYHKPLLGGDLVDFLDGVDEKALTVKLFLPPNVLQTNYIPSYFNRGFLIKNYQLLKKMSSKGAVSVNEFSNNSELTSTTLKFVLTIFQQSNLIDLKDQLIKLKKIKAVDLFSSIVYNELINEHWIYRGWQEQTASSIFNF